jgi:hypothetical protein
MTSIQLPPENTNVTPSAGETVIGPPEVVGTGLTQLFGTGMLGPAVTPGRSAPPMTVPADIVHGTAVSGGPNSK